IDQRFVARLQQPSRQDEAIVTTIIALGRKLRMQVLGYNTWLHQYVAFVLAGGLAGLAGVLFAYFNGFVSPAYLSIVYSATALIMVILGGAGTLLGPAVGSAVIIFLENAVSAVTERWVLVLGLIYVVVTLLAPDGLAGLARRLAARLRPAGAPRAEERPA
ncbi:MAG: hypothetical protein K6T26_08510, partial [Alicyclobacillus sp.]|nr:hypothetical protein [Alicyclobacillus sp.]